MDLRRLRLVLEYDGTRFCGSQQQPGQPTVLGELERRLSSVCGHAVQVVGAGRTDTGVHALGQVVHFDTTGRIPVDRVALAVNSLGGDLVVREVEVTSPDFHARYSAVQRTYHYFFSRHHPTPFTAPFVVHEPRLAAEAGDRMREALQPLWGRHDFRAFAASGSSGSNLRTVHRAQVTERGSYIRVELTAGGFVRSMVRIVAGWLLEIGCGRRAPGELGIALQRRAAPGEVATAPARGLFLALVEYSDGYPGWHTIGRVRDWWPASE